MELKACECLLLAFQVVLISVTIGNFGSQWSSPNGSRARLAPHHAHLIVQLHLSWNTKEQPVDSRGTACNGTLLIQGTPGFEQPGPCFCMGSLLSMTGSHMIHIPILTNPDGAELLRVVGATLVLWNGPRQADAPQQKDQNLLPHAVLRGSSSPAATSWSNGVAPNGSAERTSSSHLSWERDFLKTI